MTVYERLFGTPELTAKSLNLAELSSFDYCYMLNALGVTKDAKCRNCPYEYGDYGCEPRDMTWLDWLRQEVVA